MLIPKEKPETGKACINLISSQYLRNQDTKYLSRAEIQSIYQALKYRFSVADLQPVIDFYVV